MPTKGNKKCNIPDCTATYHARGFCSAHYTQESRKPGWTRRNKASRPKWDNNNPQSIKDYKKQWHIDNKEDVKGRLLQRYWPTLSRKEAFLTYTKMVEQQNNICKLCNKPEISIDKRTGTVRQLSVDHCHSTGKVRGLLCYKCNHGLGCFDDDPNTILKAMNYVKEAA